MLNPDDLPLLLATAPGLFDHPVDPVQARAFLGDPGHRMAVALESGQIVAFASGTVLLHPDKAPGLFINEVGTRDSHRRRGLAKAVVRALIAAGQAAGWTSAWLGTEPDNEAARALYRSLGGDEQVFVGYGWGGAFDAPG